MAEGVPRMRTVKKTIEELKALDEETAFTERALRRMIADGTVPVVRVGHKNLINMDLLLEKLSGYRYNSSAVRVSGKEDEAWLQ